MISRTCPLCNRLWIYFAFSGLFCKFSSAFPDVGLPDLCQAWVDSALPWLFLPQKIFCVHKQLLHMFLQ